VSKHESSLSNDDCRQSRLALTTTDSACSHRELLISAEAPDPLPGTIGYFFPMDAVPGSNNAVAKGERGSSRTRVNAELVENAGDVIRNRVGTDEESVGDLLV
jgi:hypothetical protein